MKVGARLSELWRKVKASPPNNEVIRPNSSVLEPVDSSGIAPESKGADLPEGQGWERAKEFGVRGMVMAFGGILAGVAAVPVAGALFSGLYTFLDGCPDPGQAKWYRAGGIVGLGTQALGCASLAASLLSAAPVSSLAIAAFALSGLATATPVIRQAIHFHPSEYIIDY